ncbi:MAG: internal scaffolding protein [Microviridae sp.]|nr:MAG: internal scaffolding protein [Microviridae sp.]
MQTSIIYSRYNPPGHPGEYNDEPSMTQQNFQEECDINYILRKYAATGILDNIGPGEYLDLDENYDYHQAIEILNKVDGTFGQLPSKIRDYFKNDPGEYLLFVQNPDNKEKGIELGIFNPPINPQPSNNIAE